jgi:hypothetical protein
VICLAWLLSSSNLALLRDAGVALFIAMVWHTVGRNPCAIGVEDCLSKYGGAVTAAQESIGMFCACVCQAAVRLLISDRGSMQKQGASSTMELLLIVGAVFARLGIATLEFSAHLQLRA